MFPKSGSERPKTRGLSNEAEFAQAIGLALRSELGSSRRATKTVMVWANVSDRTARAWLNGLYSPNGHHLASLAAHSHVVMTALLTLTGHPDIRVSIEIAAIEAALLEALRSLRTIRAVA